MSETGARSDPRRREWRRAQRRIARAHHPDVGGDPQRYTELMRELDRRFGFEPLVRATDRGRPVPNGPATVVIRSRPAAGLRQGLRVTGRLVRVLRTRLPRGLPGARRYIEL